MLILLLIPTIKFNNVYTWFINLFGGMDQPLSALFIIISLELITKIVAPISGKKHTIYSCYYLVWEKIITMFTVIISNIVDILTSANGTVRNATIIYYIIINVFSFFKSAEKLVIIPSFLKELFENLKKRFD